MTLTARNRKGRKAIKMYLRHLAHGRPEHVRLMRKHHRKIASLREELRRVRERNLALEGPVKARLQQLADTPGVVAALRAAGVLPS